MELVDISLTDFTRRSRSVVVAHSETDLTRGLEYGETVLARVDGGAYRAGVVADISFTATDTQYRIIVGGRVPDAMVPARLAQPSLRRSRRRVSVHDVVDILGQVNAAQRVPLPRAAVD